MLAAPGRWAGRRRGPRRHRTSGDVCPRPGSARRGHTCRSL